MKFEEEHPQNGGWGGGGLFAFEVFQFVFFPYAVTHTFSDLHSINLD